MINFEIAETVTAGGLFPGERLQLANGTTANITALAPSNMTIFDFEREGNSLAAAIQASARKCKTYPGDPLWPSKALWNVFEILLGDGVLIETVPYAAACYADFDSYDESQCNFITRNWFNGSIYQ